MYLITDDVAQWAEILCDRIGIELHIVSRITGTAPYADILRMHGRSRISIGLSISDAISTSFLEAMMLGAFPIQSDSGCANEWIEDGVSGSLVPAEDPEPIAAAILRAVGDDELVDQAARINQETSRSRLSIAVVQPQVVAMYQQVLAGGPNPRVREPARLAR
jgi:glycosyltransferase involved in cell wall biosynthesis